MFEPKIISDKTVKRYAHFTAQINLSKVSKFDKDGLLPKEGISQIKHYIERIPDFCQMSIKNMSDMFNFL